MVPQLLNNSGSSPKSTPTAGSNGGAIQADSLLQNIGLL